MGSIEAKPTAKAPWHLWVVGSLFFLLFAGGVYDNAMNLAGSRAYWEREGYSPALIDYFSSYPLSLAVIWTAGVWTALLAALLLLLRSRVSVHAAVVSLACQLVLDLITFGFRNRWQVFETWMVIFDLGILVISALFVGYLHRLSARGVLR
ncbi:hypothetical protein [Haliangium ochraceum]|uniref:Transmembrane protein n=1 Tax=Haliangium ochraceum (strain DSM 14365 / JCM 11303 / SMP-2) TaxID=502025 RepID=D0LKI1_HALO1|nr:hypothetical protein [Haliangium ochraceum]ACY15029.1 hypothetical protein Hoch_2493 [Haliangium ochraceum DSM 14365]